MASKGKRQSGFVFLDTDHFFIRKGLERKFITEKAEGFDGKPENIYTLCCDFNHIELLAHCNKKTNRFCVSAKVPCYDELVEAGLLDSLKATYGDLLLEDANEPYGKGAKWNITVAVDGNNLPEPAEVLVDKFSNLSRNIYAAPFERALTCLVEGTTSSFKPVTLNYRPSEHVFVVASPHVVQVIYSLSFADQVDRELARVSAVEFAEAGRVVEKAPGVNFYPAGRKPDELNNVPHEVDEATCIGYIVFAVSKMHVDKPAKLRRVADLLVQFRSYMLYHIKATKTELHSMMRKTYANLIQVKERCMPKGKVLHIK